MTIIVKNPTLKRKVFKKLNQYDSKAIRCYSRGDMKCGRKWETKSDNLYARNYKQIFKVIK